LHRLRFEAFNVGDIPGTFHTSGNCASYSPRFSDVGCLLKLRPHTESIAFIKPAARAECSSV
jgi:hypothetical protein